MLKKTMFYAMLVYVAVRLIAAFLCLFMEGSLPLHLLLFSLVPSAIAVGLLIRKGLTGKLTKRNMALFYAADSIVTLYSLLHSYLFNAASLGILDLLIIGSVPQIMLDAVFMVLVWHRKKYITIYRTVVEQEEKGPKEKQDNI